MRKAYLMEYRYPTEERSSIEMVPYAPKYQEKYQKMYNECFHEMREALQIEPFDVIRDDSFFEKEMDVVYLLLEGNEIIGSVALKDEIDDLIVDKRFQGRGYGRQILLWALEHMKTDPVTLHVSAWNETAVSLYRKTGFEITETIVINGKDIVTCP